MILTYDIKHSKDFSAQLIQAKKQGTEAAYVAPAYTQARLVADVGLWTTEMEKSFNVSADTPTMQMSMRHLILESQYRVVLQCCEHKTRVSCAKKVICARGALTPHKRQCQR